ncbi:MAG TPA: hypothetical protein VMC79_10230 [Rectinemataceae bacterium]|nr:hypothetical protein [Rectinemataceae bacterium]
MNSGTGGGASPVPAAGVFMELVNSGAVRDEHELRRVYTAIVKRYHPDLSRQPAVALDFDRLKSEFGVARALLRKKLSELSAGPVRFDRPAFMAEFRDLVARGFPINERAVRKNKRYRGSIEYVSASLGFYFGKTGSFDLINEQLRRLRDEIPRIYWYAMQILWNSFDAELAGFGYSRTIARRHYDCIAATIEKLGYSALDGLFLMLLGDGGTQEAAR